VELPTPPSKPISDRRLRFNRNELAGAFGDLGTDLPLVAAKPMVQRLIPSVRPMEASTFPPANFGLFHYTRSAEVANAD
jgi:hypothetical protein